MAGITPIPLAPVDALAITVLVDNVTDLLLLDDGPARRPALGSGPRVPAPILDGGEAFDALRAEHGLAALVTATRAGQEHRLLFDSGITPDGLVENTPRGIKRCLKRYLARRLFRILEATGPHPTTTTRPPRTRTIGPCS